MTVGAALLAYLAGLPGVAWGALATLPVSLFNYYMIFSAAHSNDESRKVQGKLLKRSLLRMAISMAALLIGFKFGVEVMMGVLMALVAEMMTYMGDTVRLILSMRGEK